MRFRRKVLHLSVEPARGLKPRNILEDLLRSQEKTSSKNVNHPSKPMTQVYNCSLFLLTEEGLKHTLNTALTLMES